MTDKVQSLFFPSMIFIDQQKIQWLCNPAWWVESEWYGAWPATQESLWQYGKRVYSGETASLTRLLEQDPFTSAPIIMLSCQEVPRPYKLCSKQVSVSPIFFWGFLFTSLDPIHYLFVSVIACLSVFHFLSFSLQMLSYFLAFLSFAWSLPFP